MKKIDNRDLPNMQTSQDIIRRYDLSALDRLSKVKGNGDAIGIGMEPTVKAGVQSKEGFYDGDGNNIFTSSELLPDGDASQIAYWQGVEAGNYWYDHNQCSVLNMPADYGFIVVKQMAKECSVMFYQQPSGKVWRKSQNVSSISNWASMGNEYTDADQLGIAHSGITTADIIASMPDFSRAVLRTTGTSPVPDTWHNISDLPGTKYGTLIIDKDYSGRNIAQWFNSQIVQGSSYSYFIGTSYGGAEVQWREIPQAAKMGNVNLNTIGTSGMFRVDSPSNKPSEANNYGQVLNVYGGNDTIAQMYFNYINQRVWVRSGNPSEVGGTGSWNSWAELATDYNIEDMIEDLPLYSPVYRGVGYLGYSNGVGLATICSAMPDGSEYFGQHSDFASSDMPTTDLYTIEIKKHSTYRCRIIAARASNYTSSSNYAYMRNWRTDSGLTNWKTFEP